MRLLTLSVLSHGLFFATTSFADHLDASLVPESCKSTCQPILDIGTACTVDPIAAGNVALSAFSELSRISTRDELEAAADGAQPQCICSDAPEKVLNTAELCVICIEESGQGQPIGKNPPKQFKKLQKLTAKCSIDVEQVLSPCPAVEQPLRDSITSMDEAPATDKVRFQNAQVQNGVGKSIPLDLSAAIAAVLALTCLVVF